MRARIDRGYISSVENGKYRITIVSLTKFAIGLDLTPEELLARIFETWDYRAVLAETPDPDA